MSAGIEALRKWERENPERARASKRQWAREHREQRIAYNRNYHQTHKAERHARNSRPVAFLRRLVLNAINRAKKNGMVFDEKALTQLTAVVPTVCACCKKTLIYKTGRGRGSSYDSPSIDRISNDLGYIADNIAIICLRCNHLKRDASIEELTAVVNYMRGNCTR